MTLRIYNLLAQVVAVPIVEGVGDDRQIQDITLGCGEYTAYWNGKYLNSSREAASGVYLYRLDVDGKVTGVRKFLVAK